MMVKLSVVDARRKTVLSTEELAELQYTDGSMITTKNIKDLTFKWIKYGIPGFVRCQFIQDNDRIADIKLTNQFVPTIIGKTFTIAKGAFVLSRAVNHG